jgi:hypothetical protein
VRIIVNPLLNLFNRISILLLLIGPTGILMINGICGCCMKQSDAMEEKKLREFTFFQSFSHRSKVVFFFKSSIQGEFYKPKLRIRKLNR